MTNHTTSFTEALSQSAADLATIQRYTRSNSFSDRLYEAAIESARRISAFTGLPLAETVLLNDGTPGPGFLSLRQFEDAAIEALVLPFEGIRR